MNRLFPCLIFLVILNGGCNENKKEFVIHGKICQCAMGNESKNGWCVCYYLSGEVYDSSFYVNDSLNGKRTIFYKSGKPEYIMKYANDSRNGWSTQFYENGQI